MFRLLFAKKNYPPRFLPCYAAPISEGAEIVRTDIARPDNAVPDPKLKLPWLCVFSRRQRTMETFNVLLLKCFI